MNSESSTKRGRRLWFLAADAILVFAALVFINAQADMEHNFKTWLVVLTSLAGTALAALWFLFLSRFPWRLRLAGAALAAAAIFTARQVLRVDGTLNGTGVPRFVLKWSQPDRPTAIIPSAAPAGPAATKAGIRDVPQFYGPNRDGMIAGAHLARDWRTNEPRLLWHQPIGAGWSAFSVAGQHAYTQEQSGENELTTCYDLLTGKLLWAHTNTAHFSQWQGGDGPRATPAIDQGHLYAMGATGLLDCLEAGTGRTIWSRDVLKENDLPNLIWGISCSPLLTPASVVVTGGFTNRATVLAYRRDTGALLWKTGSDKSSYASPSLATLAGKAVILSVNAASLTVHDVNTGEILLDYPWPTDKWPKASQPAVLPDDRVFISAGYGVGCVMLQIKAGSDGKLTATELWKNKAMKTQFNSVAFQKGYIYGLDDGLLACVDAASGRRQWKDGRYGSGQTLLVDDLILIQSESGEVVLAEAKPESFAERGRIPALGSKTWNHPALAGRYLLIRNDREAACYELPVEPGTPLASR